MTSVSQRKFRPENFIEIRIQLFELTMHTRATKHKTTKEQTNKHTNATGRIISSLVGNNDRRESGLQQRVIQVTAVSSCRLVGRVGRLVGSQELVYALGGGGRAVRYCILQVSFHHWFVYRLADYRRWG